jgi:hypothetical protein
MSRIKAGHGGAVDTGASTEPAMPFPEFFAAIPAVVVRDPLAELLGAAAGGLIEYRYADAVRLAGHSCPTVAGAWLMTSRALVALYGNATPVRGDIAVALGEPEAAGVAGVMAAIAGLLTGAAGSGGFKGLGGRHARRGLLRFGTAGVAGMRFTRQDTGATVDCRLRLESIPADPRLGPLLASILADRTDDSVRRDFARLWQERVRRILIDHGSDPALVDLQPAHR